jgi:S1-C subfamily serine protease
LQAGDIIIGFDHATVAGVYDLQRLLTDGRIGDGVVLTVLRRVQRLSVRVTPKETSPRNT